jgi:hypothetical protein
MRAVPQNEGDQMRQLQYTRQNDDGFRLFQEMRLVQWNWIQSLAKLQM